MKKGEIMLNEFISKTFNTHGLNTLIKRPTSKEMMDELKDLDESAKCWAKAYDETKDHRYLRWYIQDRREFLQKRYIFAIALKSERIAA